MHIMEITHQQLNINAEREQFLQPQLLAPDDDHIDRNMS
jgi:hypothetical protein